MAAKWTREEIVDAMNDAASRLGYSKLKPLQEEVIIQYVSGKDVFVSLPTGFGKSICYGSLPFVYDKLRGVGQERSIAIVVSPLISLMTDQVLKFNSMGIQAGLVSPDINKEAVEKVMKGEYQLLFISPEALLDSKRWRSALQGEPYLSNIVAFAVDEAHCVKQW